MDNQYNFALPVKDNRSLDNKFALKLLTTLHNNIKKYKSHVQKHFIRHRASLPVESSPCLPYILIFTHPHINFTAFFVVHAPKDMIAEFKQRKSSLLRATVRTTLSSESFS